jgi:hypothetical protein
MLKQRYVPGDAFNQGGEGIVIAAPEPGRILVLHAAHLFDLVCVKICKQLLSSSSCRAWVLKSLFGASIIIDDDEYQNFLKEARLFYQAFLQAGSLRHNKVDSIDASTWTLVAHPGTELWQSIANVTKT